MNNGEFVESTISKLDKLDRVLDIIQESKLKQKFKTSESFNSAPLKLKKTLEALEGDAFSLRSPIEGTITECFIDFPKGCKGLVDVKISKNSHDIVPMNDYISLDTPYKTTLREKITPNDVITIEINNHDENNSHTITVLITIIGDL